MTAKQAHSRFSFFGLAFIHSKRVGFVMAFYMYVVTVDLMTLSCLFQTACSFLPKWFLFGFDMFSKSKFGFYLWERTRYLFVWSDFSCL